MPKTKKIFTIISLISVTVLLAASWFSVDQKTKENSKNYDFVNEFKYFFASKNNQEINLNTKTITTSKGLEIKECEDWKSSTCNQRIKFVQVNNQGNLDKDGKNLAIIFDPKSPGLDFKVNVGLANKLYQKDAAGEYKTDYAPQTFASLLQNENSKLNGNLPLAAINADYIEKDGTPQGLNISRGVEYSGIFKKTRSSFGISGGDFEARKATIQTGRRQNPEENYNLVGGNGRFYTNGIFKNICGDLGDYACNQSTNRSMGATTSDGYVILLAHQTQGQDSLVPSEFEILLEGLVKNNNLGAIQDGILFDGGQSPAIYYNRDIYINNYGTIGSVFLIYKV